MKLRSRTWCALWIAASVPVGAAAPSRATAAEPPRAPAACAPADSITLRLNLPAFRLTVLVADSAAAEYMVAIGGRRYPTPTGRFVLSLVELNPAWIPPASEWARGRVPMPPGPGNPMGRAKLEFHPTYYLHGTPEPESVGSAASHGCVRMHSEDVLALSARLLRWGRFDLDDSTVARWIADPVTSRRVRLERGAAIDIVYELLEVRAGRVHVYPDPYRMRTDSTDTEAQYTLTAALWPRLPPEGTASRLLTRARQGAFSVSADSAGAGLLPAPPVPPAD